MSDHRSYPAGHTWYTDDLSTDSPQPGGVVVAFGYDCFSSASTQVTWTTVLSGCSPSLPWDWRWSVHPTPPGHVATAIRWPTEIELAAYQLGESTHSRTAGS